MDLHSFFEPFIQNDRTLAALSGGELIDISADKDARTLHLTIRFPSPVRYAVIANFAAACKKAFSLSTLDLSYSFPEEMFNTVTLQYILPELTRSIPAVNGFLNDAEYDDDGENIIVLLRHGGKDILDKNGVHTKLSHLIRERFHVSRSVLFTEETHVDTQNAEYMRIQDSIRELRVAQPEPEPEPPEKEELQYADIPISLKNAKAIYGQSQIRSRPQTIRSVTPQSDVVVVWGDVFGLDVRDTRKGDRQIITFCITDYTSSYAVKIFERREASSFIF